MVSGTWARTTPVCALETTIKLGFFRHSTKKKKHVLTREAKKLGFLSENLALRRSTQRPLANVSFFFYAGRPETPIFVVFSGRHKAASSKNALFWKPLKTRDRKIKLFFDIFAFVFTGHETPIFIVLSRPQKSGVQLSSLEVTKMGFNYAPVSIYIYI